VRRGGTAAGTAVPSLPPAVEAVFASYPPAVRRKLMAVRRLIFATAAATEGVGPLTETLKWGEPAYLTDASKSGSTIRLGWKAKAPERYALLVHCQTTLVDSYRTLFADELSFEGNRAIVFQVADPLPEGPLGACIAMALTYHRTKRPDRRR
jgi:hypothetical protein